jgi:peptidoglycan/xylan/chitin deacetylase (PgdA/CDA1 family)
MPGQTVIPILIYHSLTAEATEPYRHYSMDPGRFAEQMEHVASLGFRTLTVGQLVAAMTGPAGSMPDRPLVITFDDGFEEMHSVALPILTRLDLRSTAYLVTGYPDLRSHWLAALGEGNRPLLSAGQVRELDQAGVEIGAHGHSHEPLDELSFAKAKADIDASRAALEAIVGHPVVTFAYPHGYHTGRLKAYLRASGFASACAVKQAISHSEDDRYALARAIVGSDISTEGLDSWLRGEGLPMSWRGEHPKTRVWRTVRRVKRLVRGRSRHDGDA